MEFRIRSTGALVSYQGLRDSFPQNFVPPNPDAAYLALLGADLVLETFPPNVTDLQVAVRDGAIKVAGGAWTQAWSVGPRFTDDAEAQRYLAKLLADKRAALHDAVALQRQTVQEGGCAYRFPDGLEGTIQTRTALDLGNITGQTLAAVILQAQGVTAAALGFRDEQNVTHAMTPAQMLDMGMASSSFVSMTYTAKWQHDAAIDAWHGDTPYDIFTGWPE
jgi:hypothetical protein